ncbi:methyltransferase TYW3-domain-containing protein [Phakopsora pachyrhizi]|uniref:tRNA wybutosine-synthesizing protein 3 n=1 Tax=Phakopsora pachyrhizi TaxID=170000 RepID=A0AAV0BI00_PHAPC|nr:methyltransferase TYW3-domain-containing protein [Phakopsora pachyrhizi]CAH7686180.1 methyltransferase TYW3-domain-containing protein [Phakopsora pachyrhizi]
MLAGDGSDYQNFQLERQQIEKDLKDLRDKSPKGSIDESAKRFLVLVNSQPDWMTTSSCSGRLVTYLPGVSEIFSTKETASTLLSSSTSHGPIPTKQRSVNGKGSGNWLFVSHSTLTRDELDDPIKTLFGNRQVELVESDHSYSKRDILGKSQVVHLIYQPPVFHLLARSVSISEPILRTVIAAGFRNSGLTISQKGRVILAIRAAAGGLDVPIAIKTNQINEIETVSNEKFQLLVGLEYLQSLILEGNRLMEQNEERLDRLFVGLQEAFCKIGLSSINEMWEPAEDRKRRMKEQGLALQALKLKHIAQSDKSNEEKGSEVLNQVD